MVRTLMITSAKTKKMVAIGGALYDIIIMECNSMISNGVSSGENRVQFRSNQSTQYSNELYTLLMAKILYSPQSRV